MNWAREIAERIIAERGDLEQYTVASGISPSGFIHIGNFREFVTTYFVARELKNLGKNVRFIFSFDDFDRFRKVPVNVDESFAKYVGMPYTAIPSPYPECESYGEYFEKYFLDELKQLDIEVEGISQTKEYKSGRYFEYIKLSLDKRGEIFDILAQFKTQELTEEDKKNYYPISVYCHGCGKDSTKVINYNSDSVEIEYTCECGHAETQSVKDADNIKLVWKVDWPMRWMVEQVVFEPGGPDHSAPTSSYASGQVIVKEIFNYQAPIYAMYDFIGIKGGGDKMSSSNGNVLTLSNLLKVYDKNIILWLYAKYRPNVQFDIALDNDVIRYYSEFDRWVKLYFEDKIDEKNKNIIALTGVTKDYLNNPSFNYLATFLPIVNNDVDLLKVLLKKENINCDNLYFDSRLERAKYWIEKYGKDYQITILNSKNEEFFNSLDDKEKLWLEKTILVLQENYVTTDELQTVLYDVVKEAGMDVDEIKKAQKRYFQILYNLLLGKDQGPKLGLFLMAIDKDKIINLLK